MRTTSKDKRIGTRKYLALLVSYRCSKELMQFQY